MRAWNLQRSAVVRLLLMLFGSVLWELACGQPASWEIKSVTVSTVQTNLSCAESGIGVNQNTGSVYYRTTSNQVFSVSNDDFENPVEITGIENVTLYASLTDVAHVLSSDNIVTSYNVSSNTPQSIGTSNVVEGGLRLIPYNENLFAYAQFLYGSNFVQLQGVNSSSPQQILSFNYVSVKSFDFVKVKTTSTDDYVDGDVSFVFCEEGALKYQSNSTSFDTVLGLPNNIGGDDGMGSAATLPSNCYNAFEPSERKYLYMATDRHSLRLVRFDENNITNTDIKTIAGQDESSGDIDGLGAISRFNTLNGIAVFKESDSRHRVYVSDQSGAAIKKIEVTFGPVCSARVVVALDRTFSRGTISVVNEMKNFVSALVDAVDFGNVKMGLVNLLPHRTETQLDIDNVVKSGDKATWENHVATIQGGWNNRASMFWTLFTDIADSVHSPNHPSFIVLLTDGRLRDSFQWEKHMKLKQAMERRYFGNKPPRVACVRIRHNGRHKFLKTICDDFYYDGWKGKPLAEHAVDLANSFCTDTV